MRTILYDRHCALGAKMIDFCGWEMPVFYKGIIQEHNTVRESVGLFDVSHMGRIVVEGPDAESFLNYVSTNQIIGKKDGSATYTVLCDAQGYCIDDVIVYRTDSTHFFIIANASNKEKDLRHLQNQGAAFNVKVYDRFAEEGILALQGPLAEQVLARIIPAVKDLKSMHFMTVMHDNSQVIISRTGYTGAGGYEIYAPNQAIAAWWDLLMSTGAQENIAPVGLGARDTLRLEKGYALYGHEISETVAPTESVAAWAVKADKEDFLGKEALIQLEKSGKKRAEYGVILLEPGVAREGYEVLSHNKPIGKVTSGTFSPSLQQAIAIILVDKPLALDDIVKIQIRQNQCQAKVVKLPFLRGIL